MPSFSWLWALWVSVIKAGFVPVFADIAIFPIDSENILQLITPKTKVSDRWAFRRGTVDIVGNKKNCKRKKNCFLLDDACQGSRLRIMENIWARLETVEFFLLAWEKT